MANEDPDIDGERLREWILAVENGSQLSRDELARDVLLTVLRSLPSLHRAGELLDDRMCQEVVASAFRMADAFLVASTDHPSAAAGPASTAG